MSAVAEPPPLFVPGTKTNCVNDTYCTVMVCVLNLNFLRDIVEFALALDSLNADISECECKIMFLRNRWLEENVIDRYLSLTSREI